MKNNIVILAGIIVYLSTVTGYSIPVTPVQVEKAALTLMKNRIDGVYTAHVPDEDVLPAIRVKAVKELTRGTESVGYIVEMAPSGYVLMRADTDAAPWKLVSQNGSFHSLPPAFIEVLREELSGELNALHDMRDTGMRMETNNADEWAALLRGEEKKQSDTVTTSQPWLDHPLLDVYWYQDDPYNYYAPAAPGGPDNRAWSGCAATAMGMIMQYYKWPPAIVTNYSYTDKTGVCTGKHAASDATLEPYKWKFIVPNYISYTPTAMKKAVGQLIYHCGVTVNMDFEANASGATPQSVLNAFNTYFLYKTHSDVRVRNLYSDDQWYSWMEAEYQAGRPVFYAFWTTGGDGHAVVCDAARNGNELHINFGWRGSGTAWYNMNDVSYKGITYVNHQAILGIKPQAIGVGLEEVVIESGGEGDGYIMPGDTAGIRVWVKNNGDLPSTNPEVILRSETPYLHVESPSNRFYSTLQPDEKGSNDVLFSVYVETNAPANIYSLHLYIVEGTSVWNDTTEIDIVRLPRFVVVTNNVYGEYEEGERVSIVVSNTGIGALNFSLYENLTFPAMYDYQWSTNTPACVWQDIDATGTEVTFDLNDGMSPFYDLGFSFPFYNEEYSKIAIGANGGITFTNGSFHRRNQSLPAFIMYAPPVFLAPLWADLEPLDGGSVRLYTDENHCIISWENTPLYGGVTTETFQVILQREGGIIYQYAMHSGAITNTVGIQAGPSPAGPAMQIACNEEFIHDDMSIHITPAGSARCFTYSPAEKILQPGETTNIVFTCLPEGLSEGIYTSSFTVLHTDPRRPPLSIDMNVVVPEPVIGIIFLPGIFIVYKRQLIK